MATLRPRAMTVPQHSIYVGVILMTLQVVVAKAVTLFLAWLNQYLMRFVHFSPHSSALLYA